MKQVQFTDHCTKKFKVIKHVIIFADEHRLTGYLYKIQDPKFNEKRSPKVPGKKILVSKPPFPSDPDRSPIPLLGSFYL